MTIKEWIDEFSDEIAQDDEKGGLLIMDGFDEALVGIGQRFSDYAVIYDFDKVIEILMAQGMSRNEAVEFHEFNQLGAWMGDRTPIFLHTPPQEKNDE